MAVHGLLAVILAIIQPSNAKVAVEATRANSYPVKGPFKRLATNAA